MENVAVSRRNHTYKKGNKENAQPEYGSKSSVRREKTSAAPFQLTNNKMEETSVKKGPLKAKVDTRWTSGEALKTTEQRDGRGAAAAAAAVKQRQTHSRAFFTEHSVKHKKIVPQAPKPPAAVTSSKPAPGTYKGKIVQSKIGSIWKSTVAVGVPDPKPSALKTEGQKVGIVTKSRSKSVADLPGCGTRQPVTKRSKSVLDRPAQVTKPAVTSRPAGSRSARPPARTVLSTRATSSSRDPKVAPAKGVGTLNSKPKIPVTDKPVPSGLSQYRFPMETAEEKRAKLAEWLASKGKALKRPAMKTAEPSKTKGSAKPEADLNPHPQSPVQPAAQCNAESEPRLESQKLDAAAHRADTQGAELATAAIMNTTLDLLENSDVDLSGSVDDIVVNLCDALEAMETPSRCDELSRDVCSGVEKDSELKNDGEKEEMKNEMPEDVGKQPKVEQVKDEESEETDEDGVSGGECVTENTPQMEDASVIKYSVKTTPYLQSVKKTMKEDASASRSGRKRNIKDLKFLTPVRRSCRIERQSSRLPTMLVDPDPCVSSLAELLQLDDDPSAYICRKNPALLEDLPDCKEL